MNRDNWRRFARGEWLLLLAGTGLILTSLYLRRLPAYSLADAEILYILFVLLVITTGLEKHNVVARVARRLERGRLLPVKLVCLTFFASMLVTNDVALFSVVPLTMMLSVERREWLVILEALAANAGSALSPFGNPQNLFIYWFYRLSPLDFLRVILPFCLFFLPLLTAASLLIRMNGAPARKSETQSPLAPAAWFYLAALLLFSLAVLHLLPLAIGWLVIAYALAVDRGSLRVDYFLLLTFAVFFGFTDNLHLLLATFLSRARHVFLLAALSSQVISNVPAALLLADFTSRWQPLLWGVSVGGFGSLIASMANLIAYRLYVRRDKELSRGLACKFHVAGGLAFCLGVVLYQVLGHPG